MGLACIGTALGAAPTAAASQPPPAPASQARPAAPDAARVQADARAEEQFRQAATRALAQGRRAEAEGLARARGAGDAAGAAVLARLAADRGQYDEALAWLQVTGRTAPLSDAALQLGILLRRLGRVKEADQALAPLAASGRAATTPAALLRAGLAAQALRQPRTANALFREAAAVQANDPAVNTAWGHLYLDASDPAEAVARFRTAVKADAAWAPAWAGLARALAAEDPAEALAAARKAIEIDPALVDAHLFVAEAALERDRPADARGAIERALTVNPRSLDALALLAALEFVSDAPAAFESAAARALAVNPAFGDVYRVTAAHAANRYRYDDAAALARQAVALEPTNPSQQAALGLHLLRTGEERDARRALETAFRANSYDLVTFNLLEMLDELDTFASFPAGNATVRLHRDEAPVLRHYAVPLVSDALAKMSARYGFTPVGPILVEIFPDHDDFAVRTLGLPGLVGALGVCFGRVVTLDSPRARKPGSFNWQATLWHEMAHVFTMQLSDYRVPRWLTEGISVWEEGQVRPEWARDSEFAFARAAAEGRLPRLADLNAGFSRPDLVELAYVQSSQVVTLIVERYGEAALGRLLRAYADRLDTDGALQRALGTNLAALQSAFDDRVEQRYAPLGKALAAPDGFAIPVGAGPAAWQALASKHRDSIPVQMAVGSALAAAGAREAAAAVYQRAHELAPHAVGSDSPRARLAELSERQGNFGDAADRLASLVADDHTNVEAARRLVPLARRLGRTDALWLAFERIVTIDPYDAAAHSALGRLALERGQLPVAVREFSAALSAGPVDPAAARCDLAEALLRSGDRPGARREVLSALEIAPSYERAQELLLVIVDGK